MGDSTIFELGKTIDPDGIYGIKNHKNSLRIYKKSDDSTCGHKIPVIKLDSYLRNDFVPGRDICPVCEFTTSITTEKTLKSFFFGSDDEDDKKNDDSACITETGQIDSGHDLPFTVERTIISKDTHHFLEKYYNVAGAIVPEKWNFGWTTDFKKLEGAELYYLIEAQSNNGMKKEKKKKKENESVEYKPTLYAWAVLVPFTLFNENYENYENYLKTKIDEAGNEEAFNRRYKFYSIGEQKYVEYYKVNSIYVMAINPAVACTTEVAKDLLYGIACKKVELGLGDTTIHSSKRMEEVDDERIKASFRYYTIDSGKEIPFSSIIAAFHQKYSRYYY